MVVTTYRHWGEVHLWRVFLTKRIIRIVPIYWIFTTLKLLAINMVPSLALHTKMTTTYVVCSYLFIPCINIHTGQTVPVIIQAWTLEFEMLFYIVFAYSIFRFKNPIYFASSILIILSTMFIFNRPQIIGISFLLSPILIEFIFGMLVAQLLIRGVTLPKGLAILLSVLSICAFIFMPNGAEGFSRFLWWGVPGAILLFSALSLEKHIRIPGKHLLVELGNSSYTIYLFHAFTLPAVGIIWCKLHLYGTGSSIGAIVACLVVTGISGILIYRFFEKPLTSYLKGRTTQSTHMETVTTIRTANR